MAITYDGNSVVLSEILEIRARLYDGKEWSALEKSHFVIRAVVITEVNYDPHGRTPGGEVRHLRTVDNDFEFIELANISDRPTDLTGVRFTRGIQYRFPPGALIEPSERVLIVKNRKTFQYRYGLGLSILGEYEAGLLSNDGGQLELRDAADHVIVSVSYGTGGNWPVLAGGGGSSLEIIDASGDTSKPANWRASAQFGGSPGTDGEAPNQYVTINEVLANSLETAGDQVEIYNARSTSAEVSNWYLSDSDQDYFKFQFAESTAIPARDYLVLENDFGLDLDHTTDGHLWLIEAGPNGRSVRSTMFSSDWLLREYPLVPGRIRMILGFLWRRGHWADAIEDDLSTTSSSVRFTATLSIWTVWAGFRYVTSNLSNYLIGQIGPST